MRCGKMDKRLLINRTVNNNFEQKFSFFLFSIPNTNIHRMCTVCVCVFGHSVHSTDVYHILHTLYLYVYYICNKH